MPRCTRSIECSECGFHARLSYRTEEFTNSDICFCPVCSADISKPEEDIDDDEQYLDSI